MPVARRATEIGMGYNGMRAFEPVCDVKVRDMIVYGLSCIVIFNIPLSSWHRDLGTSGYLCSCF